MYSVHQHSDDCEDCAYQAYLVSKMPFIDHSIAQLEFLKTYRVECSVCKTIDQKECDICDYCGNNTCLKCVKLNSEEYASEKCNYCNIAICHCCRKYCDYCDLNEPFCEECCDYTDDRNRLQCVNCM